MLIHLDAVLDADDLADIRAALVDAPWSDGRDSAGTQAVQVKANQQLPHDCAAAARVRRLVRAGLDRHPQFLSAALPCRVMTPRVNRYTPEHPHYGAHVDGAIRFAADSGERVRTDISCTVFLSDPADYDGGELVIHDTYGTQRVKLAAGDAVLYPGTSVHEVTPVTRGARLGCFLWVQSLVRRDDQRRLLYEMDQAITALRTRHGDGAETVALTGTYHNLLRLWADT